MAGFGVGMFGTLLGLGGGFMIIPLLLYWLKFKEPRAVGTSHLIISLNAFSGALAYDRQRKIDYKIALVMALTAIPAVILATQVVGKLSSPWFRIAFAAVLFFAAIFILKRQSILGAHETQAPGAMPKAMVASALSGFAAGLLGIGGGVFHVPILCIILAMPIHRSTATSHFILLLSSMVAATLLAFQGFVDIRIGAWMGLGVVVGAQAGAFLSPRIKDSALKKAFAFAVLAAATAMLIDGIRKLAARA